MKKIIVSDITLKAIQEQGLTLTFREQLSIAEKLDLAKVDAIELPLLKNSKENAVIYRTIASNVKNAIVKIPVGDCEDGVANAIECAKYANKSCLQIIMPVSTTLMEYFYHLKDSAMLDKIAKLVSLASASNNCVEFVALDAFRANKNFLFSAIEVAKNNGAKFVTICDTAGGAFPSEYKALVEEIKAKFDICVSVQPSNALALGESSALESILAGADGVKTSVIGNFVNMATLSDIFKARNFDLGMNINVDATTVKAISDIINGIIDISEDNKQGEVLQSINSSASMASIAETIKQMGYELSDEDLGKVFEEVKKFVSKKEVIDTKELEAIIASTAMQVPSTYHLINYVVNSSNIISATANITLEKNGERFTGVSTGDGPIDAAFHAIEQVIGHHYELDDFQVHAVTKGRGAVGSSIIRLRANGKLYPGNGVSTDIVGACIRAYINALNKIVYEGE